MLMVLEFVIKHSRGREGTSGRSENGEMSNKKCYIKGAHLVV
ncbi:MAG: hypothetical protein UV43_C0058G0014 [Parcubacteria group bacterium GW2011_GWF2_42_7]|nr:MAG: hypothetical protein UU96_C0026G0005 [Parcubacteria group bacterium GW2011_GWC2_42_13]KKS70595.1 MAG: hypothetical protein UV43_C0058G0014 [Parcubacteria group bacterium GW2011_GWF2_42_7]